MSNIPSKANFETAYQGAAPWDIGKPQSVFLSVADSITGDVLDVGCGTGDLAIFLADRDRNVLAVDYLEEPIRRAKQKAGNRTNIEFRTADALHLEDLGRTFDCVVDSGLFHVFDDADRTQYVSQLANVLKRNGRLFFLCFSDREPPGNGPRRVSEMEIRSAFSNGWTIESIEPARFEINPSSAPMGFSDGGPHAWFVNVIRT